MPNPVIQVKKTLNELEVLGRRLDAVRQRLVYCGSTDSWQHKFYSTLLAQLLREWEHSINDYDYCGYRYAYACKINAERTITSAHSDKLD